MLKNFVVLFACFLIAGAVFADSPIRIGGGNIDVSKSGRTSALRLTTLNALGATVCRIPVSESIYWNNGKPAPGQLDQVVLQAQKRGIQPVLLFEYYTRWNGPLGNREKWKTIGRAFAERFSPNSKWWCEQGIRDWGIEYYSAINEPMWTSNNPEPIPVKAYVSALEGLADGVHSIGAGLKVSPGGFQEVPLFQKKNRYVGALAPLYRSGKLHAIDIHRYWDVDYVPMRGSRRHSLDSQFDSVVQQYDLGDKVRFYTTEMNFKKRKVTEEEAAQGFMTALWDALTVTNAQGEVVTEFVMPWNIFHYHEKDIEYGMDLMREEEGWAPNKRGQVLRTVCLLTRDMRIASSNKETGITQLSGQGKKAWVWHNRKGWSSLWKELGASMRLENLPEGASKVRVHNWQGLVREISCAGKKEVLVESLPSEATLIFVAE